jgi:hypothetical protein
MMRKTISVLALLVALTCFAYGGEMQNGATGTPQPTPVPAPATQEPPRDGETDAGLTTTTAEGDIQDGAVASFVEVMLNLLALY